MDESMSTRFIEMLIDRLSDVETAIQRTSQSISDLVKQYDEKLSTTSDTMNRISNHLKYEERKKVDGESINPCMFGFQPSLNIKYRVRPSRLISSPKSYRVYIDIHDDSEKASTRRFCQNVCDGAFDEVLTRVYGSASLPKIKANFARRVEGERVGYNVTDDGISFINVFDSICTDQFRNDHPDIVLEHFNPRNVPLNDNDFECRMVLNSRYDKYIDQWWQVVDSVLSNVGCSLCEPCVDVLEICDGIPARVLDHHEPTARQWALDIPNEWYVIGTYERHERWLYGKKDMYRELSSPHYEDFIAYFFHTNGEEWQWQRWLMW
jgi:hypothetical protein